MMPKTKKLKWGDGTITLTLTEDSGVWCGSGARGHIRLQVHDNGHQRAMYVQDGRVVHEVTSLSDPQVAIDSLRTSLVIDRNALVQALAPTETP